jgi:hypothetical protein
VIRAAALTDRAAILGLIEPHLERYPLTADKRRMFEGLTEAISSSQHFAEVAVDEEGDVRGVLIALSSDNLWARKKNCNIVAWISELPGQGAQLLRNFRDWVRTRPAIRVAGACPDLDIDSRVWDLAERIGFERHGGAYLMFAR